MFPLIIVGLGNYLHIYQHPVLLEIGKYSIACSDRTGFKDFTACILSKTVVHEFVDLSTNWIVQNCYKALFC